jgi:hypothetical protein
LGCRRVEPVSPSCETGLCERVLESPRKINFRLRDQNHKWRVRGQILSSLSGNCDPRRASLGNVADFLSTEKVTKSSIWVVADAVPRKLSPPANSLLIGKITGNYFGLAANRYAEGLYPTDNVTFFLQIPYKLSRDQGGQITEMKIQVCAVLGVVVARLRPSGL